MQIRAKRLGYTPRLSIVSKALAEGESNSGKGWEEIISNQPSNRTGTNSTSSSC